MYIVDNFAGDIGSHTQFFLGIHPLICSFLKNNSSIHELVYGINKTTHRQEPFQSN
jgi:hypothetical protein